MLFDRARLATGMEARMVIRGGIDTIMPMVPTVEQHHR
jgi:hypothetical protein